jgi:hypothetical protein
LATIKPSMALGVIVLTGVEPKYGIRWPSMNER